jgi:arabinogalactan oligomer/maltooligosaccharide transport system substrate-binding protein
MKKAISSSLLVIIILLLVSSTGQGVELTMWGNSSDEVHQWLEEAAELYEEKTGVAINVKPVEIISQDEQLAVKGPRDGEGPDIVGYPHDNLAPAIEKGLLTSIDQYLPEDYVKDNYSEVATKALTYKGDIYGVPFSYESIVLLYNKDLVSEVPKSFDQLKKLSRQLTDVENTEYGFYYPFDNFYFSYAFMGGFGGYVFGKENGKYDLSDLGIGNQGSITGVQYINSFFEEGALYPIENQACEGNLLFKEGKLAMLLDGPWAFASYMDSGIDVGAAPLPKLPNGEYPETFVGVLGYYVTNYSEHKQEAANFIKWLTDVEMAKRRLEKAHQIVPHKEILASSMLAEKDMLSSVMIQAERGVAMPNISEMEIVWEPVATGLKFIISNDKPAEQIMPVVEQNIKEHIGHLD